MSLPRPWTLIIEGDVTMEINPEDAEWLVLEKKYIYHCDEHRQYHLTDDWNWQDDPFNIIAIAILDRGSDRR